MEEKVYSYHTFILPFVWEGSRLGTQTMKELVKCFESNPFWMNTDLPDEFHAERGERIRSRQEAVEFYKEYQYFHPFVRRALYGFADNIVHSYTFMPDDVRNKAHYYIKKGDNEYDLVVNAVRVRIYNTAVGLFILECENRGIQRNGRRQDDLDSIKNINEYGRRITLPILPVPPGYYSMCADRLSIRVKDGIEFVTDFEKFAKGLDGDDQIEGKVLLTYTAGFIKDLLGYGSTVSFTSHPVDRADMFYIYPALDDRMFVACWIGQVAETDALAQGYEGDDPDSIRRSESLYELAFVDPAGNCSCPNREMRNRLLHDHTYRRWLGDSTLYTVAAQAMIGMAYDPKGFLGHLTESFLTQYIQMCCLALVQRASLIHFQKIATTLSAHLEDRGVKIGISTVTKIMNLQESFIAFESQLSFREVSPQEQAIELYDMLSDFMFIEREKASLKESLDALYDAANTNLDFSFNKWGGIFAVAATILTVPVLFSLAGENEEKVLTLFGREFAVAPEWPGILLLVILAAAAGIVMGYHHRRRR